MGGHWAVTFGTARRGLGGARVPTTVLLYNGPLLCGLNVPVKRLKGFYSVKQFNTKSKRFLQSADINSIVL